MQCDVFDRRLDDLLDRREALTTDARILEHASRCERCATVLRAHGQLINLVPQLPMLKTSRADTRKHRSIVALATSLAAVLLLGIAGTSVPWLLSNSAQKTAGNSSTDSAPGVSRAKALFDTAVSVGPARHSNSPSSQGEAGGVEQGGGIESRVSSVAIHQPLLGFQLLSQADWSHALSSLTRTIGPRIDVPRLETRWLTQVANEMTPLQESMESTWSILRRTLPPATSKTSVDG